MTSTPNQDMGRAEQVSSVTIVVLIIAWLWVGAPLAWGVSQTVLKATPLFQHRATAAPKEPASSPPAKTAPATETKKGG